MKLKFTDSIDAEQLKDFIDVDEVLEWYDISTHTHGDERRSSCPFHADNNPSFSFNVESKLWNCFVCGGGDVISFVERIEDVSFQEALKLLQVRFTSWGGASSQKLEALRRRLHKRLDVSYTSPRYLRQAMVMEIGQAFRSVLEAGRKRHEAWIKRASECTSIQEREEVMGDVFDFQSFARYWDQAEEAFTDALEELDDLLASSVSSAEKALAITDVYGAFLDQTRSLQHEVGP